MNIILYDTNEQWTDLLPLTFTRPVAELRIGILTIREKWVHISGLDVKCASRNYLSSKYPIGSMDDPRWVNGGILPTQQLFDAIVKLKPGQSLVSEGNVVAFYPSKDVSYDLTEEEVIQHALSTIETSLPVRLIMYPWDIFSNNQAALLDDFNMLTRGRQSAAPGYGNRIIGEENLFLEEDAKVNCAIINASEGPVYIGRGAEVMEGAIVRGSLALCENSVLRMSAKVYGPSTIGPYCKVGGEVFNSVFQGYSNKSHDGYLGNAVIGEWCNLGADTNNSNLKNTYEEVRVWSYRKNTFVPTGLQFCGLIMGDHSKTGINTMLNTGTVIGVSANVFGAGFPRNFIPSFSWGGAHGIAIYQLRKALGVADAVMKRRGKSLDSTEMAILEHVYNLTHEHRSV